MDRRENETSADGIKGGPEEITAQQRTIKFPD